jgi:hypothetical protein
LQADALTAGSGRFEAQLRRPSIASLVNPGHRAGLRIAKEDERVKNGRAARSVFKAAVLGVDSAALIAGLGWLGLRVWPAPFPPHPEKTREMGTRCTPWLPRGP